MIPKWFPIVNNRKTSVIITNSWSTWQRFRVEALIPSFLWPPFRYTHTVAHMFLKWTNTILNTCTQVTQDPMLQCLNRHVYKIRFWSTQFCTQVVPGGRSEALKTSVSFQWTGTWTRRRGWDAAVAHRSPWLVTQLLGFSSTCYLTLGTYPGEAVPDSEPESLSGTQCLLQCLAQVHAMRM